MTKKSQKTSTRQRVCDYLWDRLVQGDIAPGQVLVADQLAREIGVSHIPVREAMLQLCGEGVLQRSGREVLASRLDRREIMELVDLRTTLETSAAAIAATRISEVGLDDLEQLVRALEGVVEEVAANLDGNILPALHRWGVVDMMFHRVVIRAAGNREVLKVIERGIIRMLGFRPDYLEGTPGLVERFTGDVAVHQNVFEAIKKRDAEEAREAMLAHAYRARRNLLARLDELEHSSKPLWRSAGRPEYPEWLQTMIRRIESHSEIEESRTDKLPLDDTIGRVWRRVVPPPKSEKVVSKKHVKLSEE